MVDILKAIAANKRLEGGNALELLDQAATEIGRLRAIILNIQAEAETGFPIDPTKLAARCRHALAAR